MVDGIAFEHVSKRYPGVVALQDVSIAIPPGTIVGLVGENGAGKSTLTKILSGLIPSGQYEGTVYVDGAPVAFESAHDANVSGIATIPQELALQDRMSIAENILLGMWPTKSGRIDWKVLRLRALEAMRKVGLNHSPDTQVRALAPGEQQLVAICRALVRNPRVLLLDEPTASLDRAEVDRLLDVVKRLHRNGVTLVYISHRLDEVFSVCQRIVVMRDGRVAADRVTDATDRKTIVSDMIGSAHYERAPEDTRPRGEPILTAAFSLPDDKRRGVMRLADISLTLHKGELVGLVGLIGSGRTETLWSIFGALPRIGRVTIAGTEVEADPFDAVRKGIGLVTEERRATGVFPLLSVAGNIAVATYDLLARYGIIRKADENHLAEKSIHALRVKAADPRVLITALSGGNQQKALLGRWLARKVRVLLLDEPARGIDVGAKAEIYRLLRELVQESGLAILTTSSDVSELVGVCDRFLVLRDGRIAAEVAAAEADEHRLLTLAGGGI